MPLYKSQVSHNGLGAGEVVEIPDEQVEQWAGEIELGFLVPVYPTPELLTPTAPEPADPVEEPEPEGDAEPVE